MAKETRFIIKNVPYHWQRNNLNKPNTTCYNTSMATVIDYIMTKDNIPLERIGMKETHMQLEDYLYNLIYSDETKAWIKRNVSKFGTWMLESNPHTIAYVEEMIFNKLMNQFGYMCQFLTAVTYDDYVKFIDKFQLPQVLHGKYPVKGFKNTYLGHITVGIGYDLKNKSIIQHDPYGDWRTNYNNQSGKEVEYPFYQLYVKDEKAQTMWLTHIKTM